MNAPERHAVHPLLAARYGRDAPRPPLPSSGVNDVLATLLAHRSVRAFDATRRLDPGTLEWLVAAAQSAPSSSNLQVWSVVAVEDVDRRLRLARLVGDQAQVRDAPLVLVWIADLARLQALADDRGVPLDGAPYLDTFLMAVIDAALAAQNAVTAAESLGLGTCYLGAIRNRSVEVAEELGLLPGAFAVVGLCVGHPDPARPAAVKPRLPQAAVLSRERFPAATPDVPVASYDETMGDFYRSQGMTPTDWSSHSLARLAGPERLKGRDRLVEALARHGIGLR